MLPNIFVHVITYDDAYGSQPPAYGSTIYNRLEEAEEHSEMILDVWANTRYGRRNVTVTIVEYAPVPF